MTTDLDRLRSEALAAIADAGDLQALEAQRVALLGKKGSVTRRLKTLGDLPADERRAAGGAINALKQPLRVLRSLVPRLRTLLRRSRDLRCAQAALPPRTRTRPRSSASRPPSASLTKLALRLEHSSSRRAAKYDAQVREPASLHVHS